MLFCYAFCLFLAALIKDFSPKASVHVVIAEKPKVAAKIAAAIGKAKRTVFRRKVPIYTIGKDLVVIPAVGHIFKLASTAEGYNYPVFDLRWREANEVDKKAYYTKDYIAAFKEYADEADEVTVATDFDNEGSLIGYNIWRFIFTNKPLNRMKFSTLTMGELRNAFEHEIEFDYGNAIAGETRHIVDWYYGINLSRALMQALRKAGTFRVMSIGRVQGPTLAIATSRELDIQTFVPKDFWQLFIKLKGTIFEYKGGRIFEKERADELFAKIGKTAKIKAVEERTYNLYAPHPYDLTTLQMDAYKVFRFSPSKTLKLAQNLYEASLISYPRTSSQKLPPTLGYRKLLEKLKATGHISKALQAVIDELLKKEKLWPSQGKKDDPAHPAIYPTGIKPKSLEGDEKKLYALIAARFVAAFMKPAEIKAVSVLAETVDTGLEFTTKGQQIKEEGWLKVGKLFNKVNETSVAEFKEGELVPIQSKNKKKGKTKPPARYTEASLVKELEKRNLGTKATRAMIVSTLFLRRYFVKEGYALRVSELGLAVYQTLSKYVPEILNEALTREIELKLEEVTQDPKKQRDVVEETEKLIRKVSDEFKANEEEIGKSLLEGLSKVKVWKTSYSKSRDKKAGSKKA